MDHINSNIVAYLPCRKGSERVVNKNTRSFAGINGGLTKIKIQQLINSKHINKIVISTDDQKVMDICYEELKNSNKLYEIVERPDSLASSTTSTDELISYVPSIINEGHILWTHVTSPFIDTQIYDNAIINYKELIKNNKYDSLVSVTKHQKFFWDENGKSINYDREHEKWPRTQTLPPIYELNSGIFIAGVEIYKTLSDRIGKKPFMFELTETDALDIDWEQDFIVAEQFWKYKNK
jgi:CMP-N-acetylneuraminic acid synthetase